jgi:hypothetical protein
LNDLSSALRRSRELELKINKLRAVKFAKSVWHQFRKSDEELGLPTHVIATASVASNVLNPHHVQDVSLLFVSDDTTDRREAIQRRLKEIAAAPPLTKYGISGDIRVCSRDEAAEIISDQPLWLYEHGHTWRTSGSTTMAAFLEMTFSPRRMKYPPIASNVEVQIPLD